MTTVIARACKNKAIYVLISGAFPDDYTYACEEHKHDLEDDSHIDTFLLGDDENYPCCYLWEVCDEST